MTSGPKARRAGLRGRSRGHLPREQGVSELGDQVQFPSAQFARGLHQPAHVGRQVEPLVDWHRSGRRSGRRDIGGNAQEGVSGDAEHPSEIGERAGLWLAPSLEPSKSVRRQQDELRKLLLRKTSSFPRFS